jgi:putative thioredoxin
VNSQEIIYDVTAADFATRVVDASFRQPVLVDFWAAWCGPCRILAPVLERLAGEYAGQFLLAKVDTDAQAELAVTQGIRSLPTVRVFKDGGVTDEFFGALPESEVRAFIERHLVRAADKLHAAGMEAYRHGDLDRAVTLLRQATAEQSARPQMYVDLARAYIDIKDYDAADAALKALPMELQVESLPHALRTLLTLARSADAAPGDRTLRGRIETNPDDWSSGYDYAARLITQSRFEEGLEQLLEILRYKPGFGDNAAQDAMVCVFTLLGNGGELVSRYRKRMFAALH